jgi:Fe-S-cluster-containing dehydrogenase component/anaerobic selenocysteine-containing dehydrogenase
MGEISRRDFLKLTAGGSALLAGDFGSKTVTKLIPYVIPPEQIKPADWSLFATTCRECPAGCGMHVRHTNGRVVKAEGNPDHPVNRGGLCPRGQSVVQGLYDPDRLKTILCGKCGSEMSEWQGPIEELASQLEQAKGRIVFISDLQTGALAEVMAKFVEAFGAKDRLYFYEPFNYEPLRQAHREVFGINAVPSYHLDECNFIISFAADFLESWVSNVQFAWQFAVMHSYDGSAMGRMAYVGPRYSMTAVNSDDFIKTPAGTEYLVALGVLNVIIENGWAKADIEAIRPLVKPFGPEMVRAAGIDAGRITELARRFSQADQSVALAGPAGAKGMYAKELAAAVAMLNFSCGRVGRTVDFSQTHALGRTAMHEQINDVLAHLTPDDVLIVHNANLAYSIKGAPDHIRRAKMLVYMGTMLDETAKLAKWRLPLDSPLESWGDYEPQTGVHCLMQPTMARLLGTMTAGDVLLAIAESAKKPLLRQDEKVPVKTFEEWLKLRWLDLYKRIAPKVSLDEFWQNSLRAGGVWEKPASAAAGLSSEIGNFKFSQPQQSKDGTLELWPWASVSLFDGRLSNRNWLQEMPDPTSGIVWRNAADIHPQKAIALGLCECDIAEIACENSKIEAPVRITEDVAENTIAISFGQGHTALGCNAAGRGTNVFELLSNTHNGSMFGRVSIRRTGRKEMLVCAYATQKQYDREIMQWIKLSEFKKMKPGQGNQLRLPLAEGYVPSRDVFTPHKYKEHRWAMAIDLSRCIGCGACAIACYAENNVAVVGEREVDRAHWMAWLKIVPYRKQDDAKMLGFLPLLCQHCDAAPCEPVCPVFAAVHDDEGLNDQVYNRCIGTRYCSNNCPYKVRRFNWLNWKWDSPLDLQLNPEVTVRCRGVMEKCTFCIQRIRAAEVRAKRQKRKVRDGEIKPACLESCPTRVFTFGDLLDPESEVSKLTRLDPRRYHVLEELNVKPAVTYLFRILNDEKV